LRTKDQLSRAIRLTKIQHYLYRNPSGATSQELASLCEVTLRTIQRDLASLETDLGIPLLKKPYDRYTIMDGYVLPPISFTLYEALAIFLASRLVLKQSNESNPHIRSALAKLSGLLPPSLASSLQRSLEMLSRKPDNPEYLAVYEKLAIGWVTKRKLAITYSSLRSGETDEWLLEPYYVDRGWLFYLCHRACRQNRL
jgi:predicted DNA-binding transcriptional regulator YafY